MKIRLKDIAELANVDVGTVSHVLNNKAKAALLRKETRDRILNAAQKLGYCPNELARAMQSGHSRIIALVTNTDGSNEYLSRIISGILEILFFRDYSLKVFNIQLENKANTLKKLIEQRVEGVIFRAPAHQDFAEIQLGLQSYRIPCATVDISNALYGIGINSDDQLGMKKMVETAVLCGYKHLLYHSPSVSSGIEFVRTRRQGYLEGINKWQARLLTYEDLDKNMIPEHWKEKTAILCASDLLAFRLLSNVSHYFNRFPSYWGIAGYGDSNHSGCGFLPLTTVSQSHEEMGSMAAKLLIDWIEQSNDHLFTTTDNRFIYPKIIYRKSMQSNQAKGDL